MAGGPTVVGDGRGGVREVGRRLPPWEEGWERDFSAAHLRRIEMWRRGNKAFAEGMIGRDGDAALGGDGKGEAVEKKEEEEKIAEAEVVVVEGGHDLDLDLG